MTGFTKSETIIVTTIVLALVFLANFHFNLANSKARDYERKEQLKQIASSFEDYLVDNGAYPTSNNKYQFTGCGDTICPTNSGKGINCNWHQNATPNNLACGKYIYLDPVPRAPMNPKMPDPAEHRYFRPQSNKMVIETCLELKGDIEAQPIEISQTGLNYDNCSSGVIFQITKE